VCSFGFVTLSFEHLITGLLASYFEWSLKTGVSCAFKASMWQQNKLNTTQKEEKFIIHCLYSRQRLVIPLEWAFFQWIWPRNRHEFNTGWNCPLFCSRLAEFISVWTYQHFLNWDSSCDIRCADCEEPVDELPPAIPQLRLLTLEHSRLRSWISQYWTEIRTVSVGGKLLPISAAKSTHFRRIRSEIKTISVGDELLSISDTKEHFILRIQTILNRNKDYLSGEWTHVDFCR